VLAVNYLHENNIAHRDLKPENVMLSEVGLESQLKLIDFGLAKYCQTRSQQMHTKAGSCYYVAPEILSGTYDMRCDVWALGVILHIFLAGCPPFNGESDFKIFRAIRNN
jgi:calcium-dependent protein kinase